MEQREGCQQPTSLPLWIGHELGCNSFDTARIYGDSERTLGAWIRIRRNRDKVVVISNGCHPDGSGRPRLSASDVSHDLHASFEALGTDFIDLYLLHYDHPTAQVEPVPERLNRHIDDGKITSIGASNWTHERIADANAGAASHGLKLLCASTVQFFSNNYDPKNPAGNPVSQWCATYFGTEEMFAHQASRHRCTGCARVRAARPASRVRRGRLHDP